MAEVQDAIAQLSAEDQQYVDQVSCLLESCRSCRGGVASLHLPLLLEPSIGVVAMLTQPTHLLCSPILQERQQSL